jgi:quercetin dioxygenase-like cupin family protein
VEPSIMLRLVVLVAVLLASQGCAQPAASGSGNVDAPGWQGEAVCELLHEDDDVRVLRCTFAPGVGHERHHHAPHWGYVLVGGRMRITDSSGTREVDLRAGHDWVSDGVAWHEVLNIGDTTSIYLVVEPK